ncbi:olfactory receptor 8H2-like [Petromyzon marinus]|uniref:Olfactory receptor 56A4-like n=1 Tax=Petromyzon marinus TaxID=7757 RepID=A0AAJ7UEQ3_PETMA|nr:olfactory receptor 56A4-like [Petromyzon marinus]AZL87796.1 odorant receptor [Petromyzon marinus]
MESTNLSANALDATNATSDLILMATLFRDPPAARYSAFAALLLVYAFTVAANATLGLVICLEANLHRPMYVLMALLALTDVLETTNALPRIMANLVSSSNYVPMPECIAQMFFYHIAIRVQSFILTAMSVDRYVAIVHPLRYHSIMSNALVLKVFLASVALAALPIIGYVSVVVRLNFCRVKVTYSPNCDIMMISNLSCSDLYPNVFYTYANIITGIALPLLLVVAMYGLVFADLRRRRGGSSQQRHRKAVHTCVTHLFNVAVFFSSIVFTFINGLNLYTIPRDVRFPLQSLQYVVPPALNPVVYGLRTAEIRRAFVRLVTRRVAPAASAK